MAWMLVHPQIHNIFASLGVQHGDTYKVSEDCLTVLSDILSKLTVEDRSLRSFRRAIGLGQHIRKDLLPLLIHVKDDTKKTDATKIIDVTIKILVNLTIPVECLLSMDALSKTDVGRHTIFEINKLLYSSKEAFVDFRSVKAVTDHMKFMIEKGDKLDLEECDSINNCLLLLRNILHIPEHRLQISNCPLAHSSMQNRILWNLFTQSIDKLLLHLMSFPQKIYWVVTMVQLIALMYKDQHVGTLQKLLNTWFENSLSESSDDNESNTSPPPHNLPSGDSSPLLTSDPTTSDSSDNGGSGGNNCNQTQTGNNNNVKQHIVRSQQNRNKIILTSQKQKICDDSSSSSSHNYSLAIDPKMPKDDQLASVIAHVYENCHYLTAIRAQKRKLSQAVHRNEHLTGSSVTSQSEPSASLKGKDNTELSDYGYGTQVENQESISTSSNDDESPQQKPVHQKPHMVQKPRNKIKSNTPQDKKEIRRKKLIKRGKINIINIKGLLHHSPSDDDISNILKEFTVDFLLKGYGSLVKELYTQRLIDRSFEIDTSHIFWLVTYFLKFATQLELEFEHIAPVLSFNVIAYLTYEGVNLCEQLELSYLQPRSDLKPNLRRMHLVVTAIKEFLEAIESYKKISHLPQENKDTLIRLQIQISSTDNLKCLLLLLIRHYNPEVQSKQYLQDLIITNHVLLLFLDNTSQLQEFKCKKRKMGLNIVEEHLKHFANVDLMQKYGMLLEDFDNNGKFINDCIFTMMHHIGGDIDNISTLFQPNILKTFSRIWESDYDICDDWSDLIEYVIHKFINVPRQTSNSNNNLSHKRPQNIISSNNKIEIWCEEDIDALYWYYVQTREDENSIENIEKLFLDNGVTNKTRSGIIDQLFKQSMISQKCYEEYLSKENINNNNNTNIEDKEYTDLQALKEQLVKENMGNSILWLQSVLLEVCHCKMIEENGGQIEEGEIYEPVPFCYIRTHQSIPIVPWSNEDKNLLNNGTFIILLHKLGFHLPADTKMLFVRIPHFWSADYLSKTAQKLGPIDPENLNFDINLLQTGEKIELIKQEIKEEELSEPSTSFAAYPLLLNTSSNWFHSLLHAKFSAVLDFTPDLHSSDGLSVSVPDLPSCEYDEEPTMSPSQKNEQLCHVELPDAAHVQNATAEQSVGNPVEDFEHNSTCETDSVASYLTRMYVSDEEDRL